MTTRAFIINTSGSLVTISAGSWGGDEDYDLPASGNVDIAVNPNRIVPLAGYLATLSASVDWFFYQSDNLIDLGVISGTSHNVVIGDADIVLADPNITATITGFEGGRNGRRIRVVNTGITTDSLLLANDTGSLAANRITNARTMLGTGYVDLFYRAATSRWYALPAL